MNNPSQPFDTAWREIDLSAIAPTTEIFACLKQDAYGCGAGAVAAVLSTAVWLRDHAGLLGRRELAMVAARRSFEESLSLEDFEVAATLAGPDGIELRAGLLTSLAAARHAWDRIKIYLREDMIEEAMRSVDLETLP